MSIIEKANAVKSCKEDAFQLFLAEQKIGRILGFHTKKTTEALRGYETREDIKAVATETLWSIIVRTDFPTKSDDDFCNFISNLLRNKMSDYVSSIKKKSSAPSDSLVKDISVLDEKLVSKDQDTANISESFLMDAEITTDAKIVLLLYYSYGVNKEMFKKIYNVSQHRVDQMIKEAIKEMKDYLQTKYGKTYENILGDILGPSLKSHGYTRRLSEFHGKLLKTRFWK